MQYESYIKLCDATFLIDTFIAGGKQALDKLKQLPGSIVATEEILAEIERNLGKVLAGAKDIPSGYGTQIADLVPWLRSNATIINYVDSVTETLRAAAKAAEALPIDTPNKAQIIAAARKALEDAAKDAGERALLELSSGKAIKIENGQVRVGAALPRAQFK